MKIWKLWKKRKNLPESPFIDMEAYKGQDDRQAKSLGTPGLFTPSHYILVHGKVTLDANFCMCVC